MKEKILKICKLISVAALSVLLVFLTFVDIYGVKLVSAETAAEVLQDLRKDKDFDESAYPYVKDDYDLYVIQIAESSNKELFVYAYQPCHDTYDLVGTKISISYGYSVDGSGLTPELYNLKLLSTSGTLDKYYVEGFTVPNDVDRYYNIVEIFRMVNTDIDEIDPTFPVTDKACPVGQQWYVCDLNNSKHYEMCTFNTLPVETIFAGNVVLKNGPTFLGIVSGVRGMCDAWFYCFNVEDYVIDHIYDGKINYSVQHYRDDGIGNVFPVAYGSEEDVEIKVKDDAVMTWEGQGLETRIHHWDRILSSKNFISVLESDDVPISDSLRNTILSSQWVFSFLETERTETNLGVSISVQKDYYSIYEVGILSLSYHDVTGDHYDIGVVNSLFAPDDVVDIVIDDFNEWLKGILNDIVRLILIIIGIILLILILKFIPGVKSVLSFIWKAIRTVITAPFKILKSVFKKSG